MFITRFNRLIKSRILWAAILIMIVLAFVVWGTRGTDDEDRPAETAGTVRGRPISTEEYRTARDYARMEFRMLRAQLGLTDVPETEEEQQRVSEQAWKRLAAFSAAQELGVIATEEEVARNVQNDPGFQEAGRFHKGKYRLVLDYMARALNLGRISVSEYEEYVRQRLLMLKLRNLIGATAVWIPPSERQELVRQYASELTVDYVVMQMANYTQDVVVTEEKARAYYAEHSERFTIPEKVKVRYVAFPYADAKPEYEPDAADIEAYYNNHLDDFAITNELPDAESDAEPTAAPAPETPAPGPAENKTGPAMEPAPGPADQPVPETGQVPPPSPDAPAAEPAAVPPAKPPAAAAPAADAPGEHAAGDKAEAPHPAGRAEEQAVVLNPDAEPATVPESSPVTVDTATNADAAIEEFLAKLDTNEDVLAETYTNETADVRPLAEVQDEIKQILVRKGRKDAAIEAAVEFVVALAPDANGEAPGLEELAAQKSITVVTTDYFAVSEPLTNLDLALSFNKAAFQLEPGDKNMYFSDPLTGEEAAYVIGILDKQKSRVPEFEELREDVMRAATEYYAQEAFKKKVQEIHAAVSQAMAEGKSFAEAVKPFDLSMTATKPWVLYQGPEDSPYDTVLIEGLLHVNDGEVSDVLWAGTGEALIAFVAKRTPMEAPPQALMQQVVQQTTWKREQLVFGDWQDYLIRQAEIKGSEPALAPEEGEEPLPEEAEPLAPEKPEAGTDTPAAETEAPPPPAANEPPTPPAEPAPPAQGGTEPPAAPAAP
ncbi:MAG: SurA N-terminal domain-containing protein [Kiritimatiellae bacterium]|nr:SurA N-terminal domain-containing protein [Kiritimatiellia bacterium]